MVSAFAAQNELILGQLKTKGKGQELAGIKLMIELLDIEGATVTIDAGGCHLESSKKLITNKKRTLAALNLEYRVKLLGLAITA